MKSLKQKNKGKGFTLIEMMVSVGIFTIVVVFAIAALLNANLVHNKSKDLRSVMDNLSFIMEDMSRNLRTGYNYRCYDSSDNWGIQDIQSPDLDTPRSCIGGGVIVFEEARDGVPEDNTDQWVYKIESQDGGQTFDIWKSTAGGNNFKPMNTDEIELSQFSGFDVIGAEPPFTGDDRQPLVVVNLKGVINYRGEETPFSLQTSVSQRLIDVRLQPD